MLAIIETQYNCFCFVKNTVYTLLYFLFSTQVSCMPIAILSHPSCFLHEMGDSHPEQPARVQVIQEALDASSLDLKNYSAPLAKLEDLQRVHSNEYLDYIFGMAPDAGYASIDPDTTMNPHTLKAALRAAGANVHAVDLVMMGEVSAAFCNVRPPGHHAERSNAMGFCFFNNVAVGVAHALEYHKLKRVAIVDFDVHHGNGTEDIFKNDARVLFCSSFQHPFYPYSGAETQSSHILNIPLPAGSTGKIFREKVTNYWLTALRDFKPEMIFFSAGFDAHVQDHLANLQLIEDDYTWVTAQVKEIADEFCQGRIVSTLEGGYTLDTLVKCVIAHVSHF
jgi:acetoin utilization deacetylase AcuC-like enzyme